MKVTTIEGTVENGQIRLPMDARLPESARVYVVIPESEATPPAYVHTPRLVLPEQVPDFQMEVVEGTSDARL